MTAGVSFHVIGTPGPQGSKIRFPATTSWKAADNGLEPGEIVAIPADLREPSV